MSTLAFEIIPHIHSQPFTSGLMSRQGNLTVGKVCPGQVTGLPRLLGSYMDYCN